MKHSIEDHLITLAALAILVGFVGGILFLVSTLEHTQCSRYGEYTGRQVRFDRLTTECYVQTGNGWRARKELREVSE